MDIRKVQQRLKDLGFNPGPIDGIPGPKTSKAIIAFKKQHGLNPRDYIGPITWRLLFEEKEAASQASSSLIPPLAQPFVRRIGWQERRDTSALIRWFKSYGKYLGNPKKFPWCGEGMENAALEKFPNETVPSNPFWAQSWKSYGVDAGGPVVGSIGVIKWRRGGGHVGVVAAAKSGRVTLIGANQGDMIKYSTFPMKSSRGEFIAFRLPPSEVGKKYRPFAGIGKVSGFQSTR
jgi:hypothetical protein